MEKELGSKENVVVDGVEKDKNGFPVAYWVRKGHPVQQHIRTAPLSATILLGFTMSLEDFERVPAEEIRHVKLATRPGQTRGVPFLHAVMQDLRDLDLLILANLKRTQLAACLAVFIESTESIPDLLDVTAQQFGYQMDQDLTPGMIFKLYPGEKVSYLNPNGDQEGLDVFIKTLARRIGTAVGVSWATVLKDWSESNYSSARQQTLDDRPTFDSYRNLLKPLFAWERQLVLEHALLTGELFSVQVRDVQAVEFLSPRQPWIDPEKDAKAIQIQLELGLTTLRDEAAALNRDWEEVLEQQTLEKLTKEKMEMEMRESMGLPAPEEGEEEEKPAEPTETDKAMSHLIARVADMAYGLAIKPDPLPPEPARINVHIDQPDIKVEATHTLVEAPVVNMPAFEFPAPVVRIENRIEAPAVPQVLVNIDVPPQPAPIVQVDVTPELTIAPRKITVKRDGAGLITEATAKDS